MDPKNSSDLTCRVLAINAVADFGVDTCVDWALDMLALGHDTPALLILASLAKPANYFEAKAYLHQALAELHLDLQTGDAAVRSYASYWVRKIVAAEDIRPNLRALHDFCLAQDYHKELYDFYRLYWAWQVVDDGDSYNSYWENADARTIKSIVMAEARKWLIRYEAT